MDDNDGDDVLLALSPSSLLSSHLLHVNQHESIVLTSVFDDDGLVATSPSNDVDNREIPLVNNQNTCQYEERDPSRSAPKDISTLKKTKSFVLKNALSMNDFSDNTINGLSELEQLFAARKTFNSLSKKYTTENMLKQEANKSKLFGGLLLNVTRNKKMDTKQNIQVILQSYYQYETFVETPDGREELRQYLRKRHNEELLLLIETRIAFLSFYEEGSNYYAGKRGLLKVKEFLMIYSQFIDPHSQFCINIESTIRSKCVKLHPKVEGVTTEEEAISLVKDIDDCLEILHFSVSLQIKTEIFSQFKKTEEFQTFILSKIIELQGQRAWEELESQNPSTDSPSTSSTFFLFKKKIITPQLSAIKRFEEKPIEDFLHENEMSEYVKQFKRKKLTTLSQIQNFTVDDYLKLGVIKVTHQTRLIRLVGQYFKSYCNPSSIS